MARRSAAVEIDLPDGRDGELDLGPLEVHGQDPPHLEDLPLVVDEDVLRQALGVHLHGRRTASRGHRPLGEQIHRQLEGGEGEVGGRDEGTDLDAGRQAELGVAPVQAVEGDLIFTDLGMGLGGVGVRADQDEGELANGSLDLGGEGVDQACEVAGGQVDAISQREAVDGEVAHLENN